MCTQHYILCWKARERYIEALKMLVRRDNSPESWNLVIHEQMQCMLEHSLALEDHEIIEGMTREEVGDAFII